MIFYHYNSFLQKEALEESTHNILLKRFQYYLLIGGLPEAINNYLADRNMVRVRQTHRDIHNLYRIDASQYDEEHKLKIRKIYDCMSLRLPRSLKLTVSNCTIMTTRRRVR